MSTFTPTSDHDGWMARVIALLTSGPGRTDDPLVLDYTPTRGGRLDMPDKPRDEDDGGLS